MLKQVLIALSLCIVLAASVPLVPLYTPAEPIEGSYIAVFKKDVAFHRAKSFAHDFHARRVFNVGKKFKAFVAELNEDALAKLRTRTDLIKFIEVDSLVHASYETQTNATWGIDRIDQRNRPLDSTYHYFENAGEGVDIYVIDTGILTTHNDFSGRASHGYDFHNDDDDATDDNGHGTHCASTAGGTTWGLAKHANLIAVKVLGRLGSGSLSNVAAGVAWAAEQHNNGVNKKSVASMSLGGSSSLVLDNAVEAAIEEGLPVVVASGNSDDDACDYSPARVPTAITVNAATSTDARASFSNFGECTTLFAPGQEVTAAWIGSNSATNTISGTSMACPHVSGAVAVILGRSTTMPTPASVKNSIISASTANVISDVQGSPNRLLYSPYQ